MFATSVLRFCRHLRNLASQSQWDRVNGELLHMPLMHSLGDIVIGQWSCSLQQASSPAWWPRSSYDFAKVPGPHHFVPGYIRPLPGGWFWCNTEYIIFLQFPKFWLLLHNNVLANNISEFWQFLKVINISCTLLVHKQFFYNLIICIFLICYIFIICILS